MTQEQEVPTGGQVSLYSLMAKTLNGIEARQGDLPGVIAVLSLFNLFSILNLIQDQGLAGVKPGGLLGGKQDLLGTLMKMLAGSGKMGPEAMLDLLQGITGKKVSPQLLSSLLSMAGELGKAQEGGESKPKTESPQERRAGRGML